MIRSDHLPEERQGLGLSAKTTAPTAEVAIIYPDSKEESIGQTEIRVSGKAISASSVQIDGTKVISTGKWLRMAAIHDEELLEEELADPELLVSKLKASGLQADIFSFASSSWQSGPKSGYHSEPDSLAVVPITTYSDWLEKQAMRDVKTAVKKAAKLGVVTKEVPLDDSLVEGIVRIYNESKFRQGKPFWHYGKDFDTVKQMSATYPDRSTFIGAYFQDELIGFIKMVQVGNVAKTLHVISMKKYSNKKPTNALIAKAVEICAARRYTHLMYGNYVYKDPKSSLTEFKRRNGFEELLVPRYYVPLTLRGKIALQLRFHLGLAGMLPVGAWRMISRLRERITEFRANNAG